MNSCENIIVDPWNPNNVLIRIGDILSVFKKVRFICTQSQIKKLESRLDRIQIAFVHSSYTQQSMEKMRLIENAEFIDQPKGTISLFNTNYQNLEFLGDAVLDLCVASYLFNNYPHTNEGFKTIAKSKIVCKSNLANISKFLNFPKFVMISKHIET